jgi:predicted nucleic acid-binding Zn ribbon protein
MTTAEIPRVNKIFDDERDNALIARGSHFFCCGHLRAIPIEKRSAKNKKYCQQCFLVIKSEREDTKVEPPNEKITTILLQPVKPLVRHKTSPPKNKMVACDRKCPICGKAITWGNKKTKYCSDPCQKKAYLQRKMKSKRQKGVRHQNVRQN